MFKSYAYGFPRMGEKREFKKLLENFWKRVISEVELRKGIDSLERERLNTYSQFVDMHPVGEMTLYDSMLDMAIILGIYPSNNLQDYFELCRGKSDLELTKWFNTNYHFLVPIIPPQPVFKLSWNKPKEALEKFKKGIPYLIGPFTFLKLSKGYKQEKFRAHLLAIAEVYKEIISTLPEIHLDEPAMVMDITKEEIEAIKGAYKIIGEAKKNVYLFTYYDSVDFLEELYQLPVKGIGLDFVHSRGNLGKIKKIGFPKDKILIAGVLSGRNVWRMKIDEKRKILKELSGQTKNIWLSNAAPLSHLPVTTEGESLDEKLLNRLAFAREKLYELQILSKPDEKKLKEWSKEPDVSWGVNEKTQEKVKALKERDFTKPVSYSERAKAQKEILNLPLLPTTTIGSYPQTEEVRKKRSAFRKGIIDEKEYQNFIKANIKEVIQTQEALGLDVLVHGEFERTDMVEFFANKLEGIATTQNSWIISYGSRGYRPPIIYGDVYRKKSLTIEEITYAQSLTRKPVKGMLTGPITMLSWSYLREDVSSEIAAYQIALALQEEIKDYEKAGIKIIQIDEPAFREKLPLKRKKWKEYFCWAGRAFRLVHSQSRPSTQIHTHMCYSEFGEIIKQILKLDFDVISIEASRSKGEIVSSFETLKFDRQIGLGVWDIHSPAVPDLENMRKIARRALKFIPRENFWINPDCGLKTRNWKEVIPSLKNVVQIARELREEKI